MQKFLCRYPGPFKVRRRIRVVAHLLDLLASAKLHSVFHVSLLCCYIGPPPTTLTSLPKEVCSIKEDQEFIATEKEKATFESPHSPDAQVPSTWKVELNIALFDQSTSFNSNSKTVCLASTHTTQDTNTGSSPSSDQVMIRVHPATSESTPLATNTDVPQQILDTSLVIEDETF